MGRHHWTPSRAGLLYETSAAGSQNRAGYRASMERRVRRLVAKGAARTGGGSVPYPVVLIRRFSQGLF